MHKYTHLSLAEREKLYALKEKGIPLRGIARKLKREVGTISREINRHTKYGRSYLPCRAQREAERIAFRQRARAALKNPTIFLYVREHLRPPYFWSPEIIAGRLPIDCPGQSLCHESIYRYIYLNPKTKREKLWRYLVLHRKKRMKKDGRKIQAYTRLSEAIPIGLRPESINQRREIGHYETDNLEGKRSDRGAISVSVDRLTRKTRLGKLPDHTAGAKTKSLVKSFLGKKKDLIKSLTLDRGPENSGYLKISERLGIPIFVCNPYHSWEKGTVENTNQRLRRFIPKGESVDPINQTLLTLLENHLNSTPRKCLGYLTPDEYQKKILVASDP